MLSSDNIFSGFFPLKVSLIFLILAFSFPAFPQQTEIGFTLGGSNYKGDINPFPKIQNTRPGGTLFFRYNLNRAISFKATGGGYMLAGNDRFVNQPFHQVRDTSFSRTSFDAALTMEYNFLDFLDVESRTHWTPYFLLGIGTGYHLGEKHVEFNRVQPFIPIGLGFKYMVDKRFNVGFEMVCKKTFTDYLDNISEFDNGDKFSEGNKYNNDWYYYAGISFSYTFWKIPCPFSPE